MRSWLGGVRDVPAGAGCIYAIICCSSTRSPVRMYKLHSHAAHLRHFTSSAGRRWSGVVRRQLWSIGDRLESRKRRYVCEVWLSISGQTDQ